MRWFRLLAGGLLLSAAVAVAIWLAAPWWLALLAGHELERLGFEPGALAIEHVGLHESVISRLHLIKQDGTLEIEAGHARFSYSLPALIRRHLDGLNLETLDISLYPAARAQPEGGLILMSPAALFADIPVGNIDVGHITLRRFDANHQKLQELSGKGRFGNGILQLDLGEPDRQQGVHMRASLDADGNGLVQLSRGNVQIARAEYRLAGQGTQSLMQGSLQADLAGLDHLLAGWVELPAHAIIGTMQASWTAGLPAGADTTRLKQELSITARVGIDAQLKTGGQTFTMSLHGMGSYAGGRGTWAMTDDSLLRFGKQMRSRLAFEGISGDVAMERPWRLNLARGGEVHLANLDVGGVSIPQLNLGLLSSVRLAPSRQTSGQASWEGGLLLAEPADIAIKADHLRWQKNAVNSQGILLHLKAGALHAPVGSIVADGLALDMSGMKLPPGRLALDFELGGDVLSAKGGLATTDGSMKLDFRLHHSLLKNDGQLNFTADPLRFPAANPVMAGLSGQGEALDVQGGTLACRGLLQWNAKRPFFGDIRLRLQGLKGMYQTAVFSGLDGDVNIALDERGLNMSSDNLRASVIDAGLPLAQVAMHARARLPFGGKARMLLTKVQAESLGGLIKSETIDIDTGRKSNPFLVRLQHVDAHQLAEFRKQKGLSAEGLLDGTLPFDWTDAGLKMTAGTLDARAPGGLIRYLGTASMQQFAATDGAAGMAMQILSDFRYRVLHMQADYQPDGEMSLKIALKGHNPSFENGRPIEFNFNVEENVLKLLQSLRMADEISERLEKRVKKSLQGK